MTALVLKKGASRQELLDFHDHCRGMGHEWLRRQILDNDRIDILAAVVLGYEVKPFHLRMLQWQFFHPESLQLVFRGAGKTTLCTISKAIHYLCKSRDLRILLPSKTASNAESFLKEIKGHLEENRLLVELFGEFYDPHKVSKWDNKEIEVLGRRRKTKEGSITCVGVDGTIVSKHYDIILSDDLVDEDNSRTPYMRGRTKTWYYQTLDPCLEPPDSEVPHRGEHHRLGTRYHYDDTYGHLLENELKEHTQIIPALDDRGRSPWPEKYSPRWFSDKRTKSGTIIFRCHSEDTEYLTNRGWMLYDEIDDQDLLATLNRETGFIEFRCPVERHSQVFEGELYHIKNRSLDALVTAGHRFWARSMAGKANGPQRWCWTTTEGLKEVAHTRTGRVGVPVSGRWKGARTETFTIPGGQRKGAPDLESRPRSGRQKEKLRTTKAQEQAASRVVPMGSFLRFLGYFISEGSTRGGTGGAVSFSQNEGDIADRIIRTIYEIGFEPNVNRYPQLVDGSKRIFHIQFSHFGLHRWLRSHCGDRSGTKRIPRFVFDLSTDLQEILLGALVEGDGSLNLRGTPGSFWYTTTSEQLNDDLHELCVRLGRVYSSRFRRRTLPNSDQWAGYACFCERRGFFPNSQVIETPYRGRVSCFSVPNGTLVTKRNGRVLISGNSQYQCDTEAMKGEVFEYDDCQMIDDKGIPSDLQVFQGVDLAISEEDKNDKFAEVTIGRDKAGNVYVIEYYEGHLRFGAQTNHIQKSYRRHDPVKVGVESNAYQKAQYQQLKDDDKDMRVVPVHTDKDKMTRAWKLSPLFEEKRVFFRKGGNVGLLLDQLVLFPSYRWKDGFDALDIAVRTSKMRKKRRRRRTEPGVL